MRVAEGEERVVAVQGVYYGSTTREVNTLESGNLNPALVVYRETTAVYRYLPEKEQRRFSPDLQCVITEMNRSFSK